MEVKLVLHKKLWIKDRYLLEMSVHQVPKSLKYPQGFKYGMIFIDIKTSAKVLMDNHHPKGPHVHINEYEFTYKFDSIDQLVSDFNKLVLDHMGLKL